MFIIDVHLFIPLGVDTYLRGTGGITMKRVKHIPAVPFPRDFHAVVAESSQADLRMLQSGAAFVPPHNVSNVDSILVVASTPQFLHSSLESLAGRVTECWLMVVDTSAESLAEMLEGNAGWTLGASADEANILGFRIRPNRDGDLALHDTVAGLRLASALAAQVPRTPVPSIAARTEEPAVTLKKLIKRRIPRTVKTLAKKALSRR